VLLCPRLLLLLPLLQPQAPETALLAAEHLTAVLSVSPVRQHHPAQWRWQQQQRDAPCCRHPELAAAQAVCLHQEPDKTVGLPGVLLLQQQAGAPAAAALPAGLSVLLIAPDPPLLLLVAVACCLCLLAGCCPCLAFGC
jgi:hypothetical protein